MDEVYHAPLADLMIIFADGSLTLRLKEWGGMNAYFEVHPDEFDTRPFYIQLPNGQCQCPHWGYVLQGRICVLYAEREEIIEAGHIFYIAPGHNLIVDAGTQVVMFSPHEKLQPAVNALMGS